MYRSEEFPFIYSFPILEKFRDKLRAGVTGREGGVSHSPFNSFNTALHTGDDKEAVIENRKRLCSALDIEFSSYTCAEQVHGSRIRIIYPAEKGRGRADYGDSISQTDSLITFHSEILINIHLADCIPVILYDYKKNIGALAHAGWKGTAGLIALKTAEEMISSLGCRPETIVAAIGPGIGSCCFEIGSDTAEKLADSFSYSPDVIKESEGIYHCDLEKANVEQLLSCGIKKENIECASACTSCRKDEFYSYRADGGTTGRFSAFLLLR